MKKSNKKCIGVVSDLHIGHVVGLLPPEFTCSDGGSKLPNKAQAYLWECWLDFCAAARERNVSAIVLNGDIVDGRQQAQRGTELALPIVEDQAAAAEEVLAPLFDATGAADRFFVAGTEYHDQRAGREVEVVARRCGGRRYQGIGTGRYCREVLNLDVSGVVLNVAHAISCSTGLYRATAPDKEALFASLQGKDGKMPSADCLIRSHAHSFTHIEHESKHIVVTPCWQLQTRYMRKNSVYRMLPSIGGVFVHIDPDLKALGEDPVRIEKRVYKLPPVEVTKL